MCSIKTNKQNMCYQFAETCWPILVFIYSEGPLQLWMDTCKPTFYGQGKHMSEYLARCRLAFQFFGQLIQ